MNTYVAVVIACALVCPDYIAMVSAGESITFAGIPVTELFGITEPAIYGVNLRLKRPMICGCIAGAFNAVSRGYNMPGVATIPAYFKSGHATQFIGFLISIAVSFVLGAVLTYIVGFKDDPNPDDTDDTNEEKNVEIKNTEAKTTVTCKIAAPVAICQGLIHQYVFYFYTL